MPLQEQEGGGRGQACTDSDFVSGLLWPAHYFLVFCRPFLDSNGLQWHAFVHVTYAGI